LEDSGPILPRFGKYNSEFSGGLTARRARPKLRATREDIVKTMAAFAILLISPLAGATAEYGTPTGAAEEAVLWVGPQKVDCVGVAPMKCLQVRWAENGPWEFFYDAIEGFTWEAGYLWKLKVRQQRLDPATVPADASSIRWSLVEVLEKTPAAPDPAAALPGRTWTLQKVETTGDNPMPSVLGAPTLQFGEENRISGATACNRFMGTATPEGATTLVIGPLATTRMMCEPDRMQQEQAYTQLLQGRHRWAVSSNELRLTREDGRGTLVFSEGSPAR
jgi:heat shock protein HslJ